MPSKTWSAVLGLQSPARFGSSGSHQRAPLCEFPPTSGALVSRPAGPPTWIDPFGTAQFFVPRELMGAPVAPLFREAPEGARGGGAASSARAVWAMGRRMEGQHSKEGKPKVGAGCERGGQEETEIAVRPS